MENSAGLSKQSIIEYVHQWGSSVIESILDPSCNIFSVPEIKGLIGFHSNRKCAVVFGDPVCAPEDRERLVQAFHTHCENQKKNVIYLVASETFAKWMQERHLSALIPFGEELFLDPQSDPLAQSGKKGISLRGKIRHAEKKKVLIKEYNGEIPELEEKFQDVVNKWLKNRKGPQIYISPVHLFSERFGKRWFYAEKDGDLVGCLVLNKLQVKEGWALDRIITVPDAPQGTSELLVISVMEALAQESCRFLTFGATNGTSLGEISGFGKLTSFLAHHLYKASIKLFNLGRRGKYWEKFHPESSLVFLVFKNPHLGFHEVNGMLHALNVSFSNKFR